MARYGNGCTGAAVLAGIVMAPLVFGTASAQTAGMTAPGSQGQPTQGPSMQNQAPGAMGGAMGAMPVSPATVAKAGKAMRNVLAINKSYSAKLSGTTDPAAKSAIVAQAKQKAMSAITDQGLTVGQYNQVLASAEQNPQLRQQLLNSAGVAAN